jgi:hypothetical protein
MATDCRIVRIVCLEHTGFYLLSQFTSGIAENKMVLRMGVADDKHCIIRSSRNFVVFAVVEDEVVLRPVLFEKKL